MLRIAPTTTTVGFGLFARDHRASVRLALPSNYMPLKRSRPACALLPWTRATHRTKNPTCTRQQRTNMTGMTDEADGKCDQRHEHCDAIWKSTEAQICRVCGLCHPFTRTSNVRQFLSMGSCYLVSQIFVDGSPIDEVYL